MTFSGFGFVAFVYGYVEVGDGSFGEGVAGDGVIAKTTEDGDLFSPALMINLLQ